MIELFGCMYRTLLKVSVWSRRKSPRYSQTGMNTLDLKMEIYPVLIAFVAAIESISRAAPTVTPLSTLDRPLRQDE